MHFLKTKFIVGQNVGFDVNIMGCEFHRMKIGSDMIKMPVLDTCTEITAEFIKTTRWKRRKFKLPTLTELHQYLFNQPFAEAHNATADVEATTRCFLELIKREIFTKEELDVTPDYFRSFREKNLGEIQLIGLKHINLKQASDEIRARLKKIEQEEVQTTISNDIKSDLKDAAFAHLHNHTQFSVLQSTIAVNDLVSASAKFKMPAVAMTDTGNMMGAFHFVSDIMNHNKSLQKQKLKLQLKR